MCTMGLQHRLLDVVISSAVALIRFSFFGVVNEGLSALRLGHRLSRPEGYNSNVPPPALIHWHVSAPHTSRHRGESSLPGKINPYDKPEERERLVRRQTQTNHGKREIKLSLVYVVLLLPLLFSECL